MGDYMVDILTPDNGGAAPSIMYSVSGGANGTATASLFSASAWTSQNTKLDTYLGISASCPRARPDDAACQRSSRSRHQARAPARGNPTPALRKASKATHCDCAAALPLNRGQTSLHLLAGPLHLGTGDYETLSRLLLGRLTWSVPPHFFSRAQPYAGFSRLKAGRWSS
jgi:hypothetical protein